MSMNGRDKKQVDSHAAERRQRSTRLRADWIMREAARQCGVSVRPDVVAVHQHERTQEIVIGDTYHFQDANKRDAVGGAYGNVPLNCVKHPDGGFVNTYR